jgi:fluoroquinolone resistance protein
LQEADFTGSDLSGALFDNCDLQGALFENTNLEKTDLYSSYQYSIDPEKNRIRKARFSREGISGLLGKYDIEIL